MRPIADAHARVRRQRRQVGQAHDRAAAGRSGRAFSRITVAVVSVDALLQQPAQAPVVLHPVLELGVLRVGRLEVGQRGEELGVVLGVRRPLAGDDRQQLPLVDEVAVAAQRRARPQVVREPEPLVLAGARAHLHLAVDCIR